MLRPSTTYARPLRAPRADAAGFTLVELMVALSGGLFLSMVVFALARDSTRFYQREGRIASATLAGVVGFERLKADIERAGYLSTPNIQADPNNCTPVSGGTPAGLMGLAALRITPDTPDLSANPAYNLNAGAGQVILPDQIVLSGSYSATDEFTVAEASNGQNITLQASTPAMARLGYLDPSLNAADQLKLLQNVFGFDPGQILRYKDSSGKLYFGEIAAVTAGATPSVTVTLPFPVVRSQLNTCGIHGTGSGDSVNVVNLVRYRILDLQHDAQGTSWAPLFTASAGAIGEDSRTELVRDQLSSSGAPIAHTTDVVAEYAVDLDFSVTGQLVAGNPALTQAIPGSSAFTAFFAANAVNDRPQGVRIVRVRLGVRSREADRPAKIAGGLYRFQLGPSAWARVRSFQADVALPNQRNIRAW